MSSTVTLYVEKVRVESLDLHQVEVTLEGVDASDFVGDFMVNEVLDAIDISDIQDYLDTNL